MTADEKFLTAKHDMEEARDALDALDVDSFGTPEYIALDEAYRVAHEAYAVARIEYLPHTAPRAR